MATSAIDERAGAGQESASLRTREDERPEKRSPSWRAYAALATGVACITWSAIFVKLAPEVSGPASAFYRVFFATLLLFPLWIARRRPLPPLPTVALAALGGMFFGFDLGLFNSSIVLTSATNTTLLSNNTPLWVGLGTWLFLHTRPSARFWLGLAITIAGTVALVGSDALHHPQLGWGDVMAIASSICFAAYLLTTYRTRAHADTLTLTTVAVAGSAVTLLAISLVLDVPMSGYSNHAWAALLGLGLISQFTGYLAITYALGHLPATVTSVSLLAQAPLTALLAMPILGERLSAAQIVGGSLVLTGIYVVNRDKT